jgi:hypothetical protein
VGGFRGFLTVGRGFLGVSFRCLVGFRGCPHCGQGFPSGAWWVSGGFPTVGRGFLGISFRCLAGLRGFSYFRALFAFILFVFDFFVGFLVCFCLFCFFVCFLCQYVVCVVFFFIRFWVVVSLLSLFLFFCDSFSLWFAYLLLN